MKTSIAVKTFLIMASLALAASAPAKDFLVYFGTYTNASSKGIYVSRLDAKTGKLSEPQLAAATPSPCYLNASPNEKFLYTSDSVSTFGGKKAGAVSAFAIDKKSGKLTFLNQKSSGAEGPCHVSVDATGKTLFVANYGGACVKSIPLNDDGSIGDGGNLFKFEGRSVHPQRQTAPYGHFITAAPGNRFVLACDLGTDRVMIYKLVDGVMTTNETPFGMVPAGSGPRHLTFSHNGKFVYALNEMACTVTTFSWDSKKGKLTPVETVSALPADVAVQASFTAAEILTAGKFVYATVRGHDSVSVFAADAKSGRLTFVQNVSCGGNIPRGLGIDPTGRWLITGNQKSENVAVFAIDKKTGMLSPTGLQFKIGSPVDVKFVEAE